MQPGKQRETASSPVDGIDASASPRSEEPTGSADRSPCAGSGVAATTAEKASKGSGAIGTGKLPQSPVGTLREEVREALRRVLSDPGASAAAKASAGRTLMEFFDDGETAAGKGRGGLEMTAEELDAEISRLTGRRS